MFFILILRKWNLHVYTVTKFHKTPISMNKEGVACFCKKKYSHLVHRLLHETEYLILFILFIF